MFCPKWMLATLVVLLIIALPFVNWGWKRWLAMAPQPLSNQLNTDNNESFNGLQGSYYEVSIPLALPADKKLLASYRL